MRPIAGQINFNLEFTKNGADEFEENIDTALHELTHVLAFSPSLYDDFVDSRGNKRSGVTEKKYKRGYDTYMIKTPKVLEVSRNHFGCNSISGMELENQGGSGSLGAHWERTILHNEYMTASSIKDAAVSKFTMALLEDSGWYNVDYNQCEPFFFG